jgi:hypothetical protein
LRLAFSTILTVYDFLDSAILAIHVQKREKSHGLRSTFREKRVHFTPPFLGDARVAQAATGSGDRSTGDFERFLRLKIVSKVSVESLVREQRIQPATKP